MTASRPALSFSIRRMLASTAWLSLGLAGVKMMTILARSGPSAFIPEVSDLFPSTFLDEVRSLFPIVFLITLFGPGAAFGTAVGTLTGGQRALAIQGTCIWFLVVLFVFSIRL